MEAPETQGKRTVFMILVSSCVFFCAVKVIRLVRFQGRQGGFMSSKAQTREKDYERGLRIADRRKAMGLSQDELAHRVGIGRQDSGHRRMRRAISSTGRKQIRRSAPFGYGISSPTPAACRKSLSRKSWSFGGNCSQKRRRKPNDQ